MWFFQKEKVMMKQADLYRFLLVYIHKKYFSDSMIDAVYFIISTETFAKLQNVKTKYWKLSEQEFLDVFKEENQDFIESLAA